MELSHAVILAIVQGFTEFLPVSSSAHLILIPMIAGWNDQGLVFDVAVHVGTLIAVVLYYRRILGLMASDFLASLRGRAGTPESKRVWYMIIGTIPVGIAGLAMPENVENALRSPLIIAGATIGFGLLLWYADKNGGGYMLDSGMTWKQALLIGLFQALALIPGASRSGVTISAGLLLELKREVAARFSFLLSIPVIVLAGLLKALEMLQTSCDVDWSAVLTGMVVSAVAAYLSIGWFLALLQRIGLFPFVIYRFLLGGLLIWVFL